MYVVCIFFGIFVVSRAYEECTTVTKVGQTYGNRVEAALTGATFLLKSIDNEFRINCSGYISEWDFSVVATGILFAEIWRQVRGTWTLIGVNKIKIEVGDVYKLKKEVIQLADQIGVEGGDYLAFKSPGETIVEYIRTSNIFIGNTDQIQFSTTAAHTVTSTSIFSPFTQEPNIEFAIRATISPACKVVSYGENCALLCNDTCIGCNRANAICDSGCNPGWKGTFCDEEYDLGLHGEDGGMQCGHCSESLPYHAINGSCLNGCAADYEGFLCNKTCSNGWYGLECQEKCGYCKGYSPCHRMTGSCCGACEPGYSGDECNDNVFFQLLENQKKMLNLMVELISDRRGKVEIKGNFTSPTDFR